MRQKEKTLGKTPITEESSGEFPNPSEILNDSEISEKPTPPPFLAFSWAKNLTIL